jgi:hypothetical protein
MLEGGGRQSLPELSRARFEISRYGQDTPGERAKLSWLACFWCTFAESLKMFMVAGHWIQETRLFIIEVVATSIT